MLKAIKPATLVNCHTFSRRNEAFIDLSQDTQPVGIMRVLAYVGIFILFSSLTFAQGSNLTCQYRYNYTQEVEKINVYDSATNHFVTDSIRYSSNNKVLTLYNDYDSQISVRTIFDYGLEFYGGVWKSYTYDNIVTIPPRDFQKISIPQSNVMGTSINNASLQLIFQNNNETFVKYEKENVTMENCTSCNGNICLNDGAACGNNMDCGTGFCVEGRCADKRTKADADARVAAQALADEKAKAEADAKNAQATADAAAAAASKGREQNITLLFLAVFFGGLCLIFIIVLAYLIWKWLENMSVQTKIMGSIADAEKKSRDIDDKERELIEIAKRFHIEKLKLESEKLKLEGRIASMDKKEEAQNTRLQREYRAKRIELESQLGHMQDEFESQKNKLEKARADLARQMRETEEKWKELKPSYDPLANNKLIIVNPYLGGYRCFYKKGLPLEEYPIDSLLHRWIWMQHHKRYPRKGYHIHHIDHDKYNNSIENLEEIEGEEHFRLHRGGRD